MLHLRYVRMEIPLHIVPCTYISQACLDALVRLPEILCQEEQDMYNMTKQVPGLDLLTRMHNNSEMSRHSAMPHDCTAMCSRAHWLCHQPMQSMFCLLIRVFVKALCNIAESVSGPLLQSLENRLRQNRDKIERMRAEKDEAPAEDCGGRGVRVLLRLPSGAPPRLWTQTSDVRRVQCTYTRNEWTLM
ncbi:hypothetical protein HPB51_014217 [Rhipicephalus microplus]|uniref:BRCC36 C-terminal helical domain-containing protein n=1 Tax=Rhipicephalus microplus TaxID=6941 RepID=A0A9J6E1W3_RHIMP|nr:hypothetical protein HPB51_014217 [Rhipicephalus microplus]